ncbi:MAG: hypothetical protein GC184_03775 [Rhizobiales bacterium]|nr:hypothetical protein [Hyphomicrobiales bacterium]
MSMPSQNAPDYEQLSDNEIIAMAAEEERLNLTLPNLHFWKHVFARYPQDRTAAYQMVRQYFAGNDHQELEDLYPGLLQRFPRHLELHVKWAELALLRGDTRLAASRHARILAQFPNAVETEKLAYRICIAREDFTTAAEIATRLAGLPNCEEFHWRAKLAAQSAVVAASWAARAQTPDYRIYVLNLDKDQGRLRRINSRLAAKDMAGERIAGVPGAYLPDLSSLMLTKDKSIKMKGTLGCFLTHLRAWEACAEGPDAFALILEDDAIFNMPLPPSTAALGIENNDFDLCFVNGRIQAQVFNPDGHTELDNALPADEFLMDLPADIQAAGGDGYFLSRNAARKLLDMVRKDGLAGDVDWRLIHYVSSKAAIDQLPADGHARKTLALHQAHDESGQRLKGYVYPLPIIDQIPGISSRIEVNELEHAHLE